MFKRMITSAIDARWVDYIIASRVTDVVLMLIARLLQCWQRIEVKP